MSVSDTRADLDSMQKVTRIYLIAKRAVVDAGYAWEIAWQQGRRMPDVTVEKFMREAAWVVLSAGMSEMVVRKHFDRLTEVMHDWNPAAIVLDKSTFAAGLKIFQHRGKMAAIQEIAAVLDQLDHRRLFDLLSDDAESFLRSLPYIGPVTWAHLAKNIGAQVAKADRHLARLARLLHKGSASDMCEYISIWTGEPVPVVDIVLWRYSVLHLRACASVNCDGTPHALVPLTLDVQ